jgi:hypothetical protein
MTVYRAVGFVACCAVALVGMSVAFLLSLAAAATLCVCGAVVGAILRYAVIAEDTQHSTSERAEIAGSGAAVGAVAAGAFMGYTVLLGGGVLLAVLAVLLTAPPVLGTYLRWLRATPLPSSAQMDRFTQALASTVPEYTALAPPQPSAPSDPPPDSPTNASPTEVQQLTDEQLCKRWRASYLAVQQPQATDQMMRSLRQRQLCLDELQRRNEVGFDRWLASNPQAAGNPLPYIRGQRKGRCSINWDDLNSGHDGR